MRERESQGLARFPNQGRFIRNRSNAQQSDYQQVEVATSVGLGVNQRSGCQSACFQSKSPLSLRDLLLSSTAQNTTRKEIEHIKSRLEKVKSPL